jgi:uncharacterized protein DUF5677
MTDQSRFNDIGFLSTESTQSEVAIKVTSSHYYELCKNLNKVAQTLLNDSVVHPDDRKEVYATLYFQRMLSHYQAILIMAERCMFHQVEVMLRCMLEALFNLVAFHENEELFEALVIGDSSQRLELLQKISQQQKTKSTFTKDEMDDLTKTISSADSIDIDNFKVFMKADLAGMLHEYRTTYANLSQTVHSTIHSLEDDLISDPKTDEILGINVYGEKVAEISTLLMTSSNYLLVGLTMHLSIFPNSKQTDDVNNLSLSFQAEWQNVVVSAAVRH